MMMICHNQTTGRRVERRVLTNRVIDNIFGANLRNKAEAINENKPTEDVIFRSFRYEYLPKMKELNTNI